MRKKSITEENSSFGIRAVAPWRVTKVIARPNYQLEVKFVDGVHGFVEMSHLIMSEKAGVFAALKDKSLFEQAYLEHDEIKKQGRWVL